MIIIIVTLVTKDMYFYLFSDEYKDFIYLFIIIIIIIINHEQ